MYLEILTPEQKLFEGEISGIKMPGIDGSFELLNNHAPILAALSQGRIRINSDQGKTEIDITTGFVECLDNKVVVLIESGQLVN